MDERRILVRSLGTLALFESGSSSPDALAWLAEAQEIARAGSMGYTELWVMSVRAIVLEVRGRIAESIGLYRSVLDVARRFEAPAAVTLPAANLAAELLRTGSIDEARTVVLSALHTADQAGHRIWASAALQELGEVEAGAGRWSVALTLLVAARALTERMGMVGLYTPGEMPRLQRIERYVGELLGEGRAAVVARAERMSYREAVTFAADTPLPAVSIGSAAGATSGAGAPSSR